jgi:hypothetical protein
VHERPEVGGGRRGVKVGVVEHEQRRFAAQLQQRALEQRRRLLGDDAAHPGGPGEVDVGGFRMLDEGAHDRGGVGRVVGDEADRAGGHAGVHERRHDRTMHPR